MALKNKAAKGSATQDFSAFFQKVPWVPELGGLCLSLSGSMATPSSRGSWDSSSRLPIAWAQPQEDVLQADKAVLFNS